MEKDTEEWLKNFATLKDLKLFFDERYPYCANYNDITQVGKLVREFAPKGKDRFEPDYYDFIYKEYKKIKKA